jgi:hypothetical protein
MLAMSPERAAYFRAPFQGFSISYLNPRALPWAVLVRPGGAENTSGFVALFCLN